MSSCNDLCIAGSGVIVSAHIDKSLRFWDKRSGKPNKHLQNLHSSLITALASSPDGRTIASIGKDNEIKLIDLNSYKIIQVLKFYLFIFNYIPGMIISVLVQILHKFDLVLMDLMFAQVLIMVLFIFGM